MLLRKRLFNQLLILNKTGTEIKPNFKFRQQGRPKNKYVNRLLTYSRLTKISGTLR
jgi:hypothetical protein